ncbi:MAG: hypothetical protein AAF204_01340 [Pseudomonadota bacterium]
MFLPQPLAAQPVDNSTLDVIEEPICFVLRNEADYRVNGSFATAKYTRPDGIVARHRSNFRLEPAGKIDPSTLEQQDRAEFCSYGPFLPDRKLILTLRSLFPIFECKTRVDTGEEIVIKGQRRRDDSGVITWAECFETDGTRMGKPAE